MSKRAATLELVLAPNRRGEASYRWLGDELRAAILDGRLRPGARLPATRDLARQYDLARGTIVAAFEQLKSEGYVVGHVGSGTFVNRTIPDDLLLARMRSRTPRTVARERRAAPLSPTVAAFPEGNFKRVRPFRANVPALQLFPVTLWARIAARRLRRITTAQLLGTASVGYPPLRAAIADYLRIARGVRCAPEQILVVSGTQEALDLVARTLTTRGGTVCMEDPGYVGASRVFQAAGTRVVHLPVDDEGMRVPSARQRAALVYVTPAHQFPLGIGMSVARRLALLEWARACNAFIFEDDYDSEFRYAGRPLPALQSLDTGGRVIVAGSFSKVLFPSLRLGYLVLPQRLIDAVAALKSVTSRHAPLLDQLVLTDFMTSGHFARHIRRMREVYAERLSVLVDSARESLGGLLEVSPIAAGLQTVGWLADGISAPAAARAAAERDVAVAALGEYATRTTQPLNALHLGFAAFDPHEIRRGVRDLALALEPLRRRKVR